MRGKVLCFLGQHRWESELTGTRTASGYRYVRKCLRDGCFIEEHVPPAEVLLNNPDKYPMSEAEGKDDGDE